MNGKPAILFLTHEWRPVHARRFERLCRETEGLADCHVLYHSNGDGQEAGFGLGDRLHAFMPASLEENLGYPLFRPPHIVPGSAHLPVIDFARRHPHRRYWVVENDVEFSGNWARLIARCAHDNAELIAAHVRTYVQEPNWYWYPSLRAPRRNPLNPEAVSRAFFPLYRISHEALMLIHQLQKRGWRGHYEPLIPTLLTAFGMQVREFSEIGVFYRGSWQDPPENEYQLERLSTHRWRPEISRKEFLQRFEPGLIFHPVKDDWTFNGEAIETTPAVFSSLPVNQHD